MVDPIGISTARVDPRTSTVAPVRATAPVAASVPEEGSTAPAAQVLARSMAQTAPVDADRVAMIKKAVANGTFPIFPAKIADRLVALKLEWNPNDKA